MFLDKISCKYLTKRILTPKKEAKIHVIRINLLPFYFRKYNYAHIYILYLLYYGYKWKIAKNVKIPFVSSSLLLFPRMLIFKQIMKIKGAKAYYIINTVTLWVYAVLSKYIKC